MGGQMYFAVDVKAYHAILVGNIGLFDLTACSLTSILLFGLPHNGALTLGSPFCGSTSTHTPTLSCSTVFSILANPFFTWLASLAVLFYACA
jgi:hypothetical protein